MADWKSEYAQYGMDMEAQLGEDIFNSREYRPDNVIVEAIGKYRELQKTPSLALIDMTRMAVDSIKYYFQEITINKDDTAVEKKKKLEKFDLKKVLDSVKQLDTVVDSLNRLEEKVMKEEKDITVKIRGGGNAGIFEETAPWLKENPK